MESLVNVFEYLETHIDDYVSELSSFCSIGSTASKPNELENARRFLIERMARAGISTRLIPVADGNAMISGFSEGKSKKRVLFYNHYDVVEPGDPEKWNSKAPFNLLECDGYLYARGISDDKGPLLSRVQTIEAMKHVLGELPVQTAFLFEGDEESGSPSMMKYSKANPDEFKKLIQSDICFWENGRRQGDGGPWARYGVRGACTFELKVKTAFTDVHGRMGAIVPSASWRLIWALACLKGHDEKILISGFYDGVQQPTEEELRVLEEFPYAEEKQREKLQLKSFLKDATGLELKKQLYFEPTLSVCGLEAGEMYKGPRGIVPHEASARISCYLVANQNPDKIAENLKRYLSEKGFDDIEITYEDGSWPVKTPINIPETEILEQAALRVYGQPLVKEVTQLGGGPAIALRRVIPDLKIVGMGPANTNGNHHAPNENLRKSDLLLSMKMTAAFLYGYGGAKL